MDCLIVGNLTLDKIGDKLRIGGPGLYGGWALYLLGCKVHVLTSMNSTYRRLFRGLMDKFVFHEYNCGSLPIFIIREGRAVGLDKQGCRIDWCFIEQVINDVKPDILIFTPVYHEIEPHDLKNYRGSFKVVALDIQGLTRRLVDDKIVNIWDNVFFKILSFFDIVHGNIRELSFADEVNEVLMKLRDYSMEAGNAFLVSMDEKGLYLVYDGKILYFPPMKVKVYNDVGAGDVLLAVTSYYYALGYDIVNATKHGLAATLLKIESVNSKWFNEEEVLRKTREITYRLVEV